MNAMPAMIAGVSSHAVSMQLYPFGAVCEQPLTTVVLSTVVEVALPSPVAEAAPNAMIIAIRIDSGIVPAHGVLTRQAVRMACAL